MNRIKSVTSELVWGARSAVVLFVLLEMGATEVSATTDSTAEHTPRDTKIVRALDTIKRLLAVGGADSILSGSEPDTTQWRTWLDHEPLRLAAALERLADTLEGASGVNEVEFLLQTALELRVQAAPDDLATASAHVRLVRHHYGRRQYTQARRHQERAIAIRSLHEFYDPNVPRSLDDYYNLGHICYLLDDHATSAKAFQLLLNQLGRASDLDHKRIARTLSDLGEAYRQLGDYAKAESLTTDAIRVSEERLPDSHHHAVFLNNLGMLLWDQDRLDEAERYLRRALDVTRNQQDAPPLRIIRAYENLGVLSRDQLKYDQAETFLKRAEEIARENMPTDDVRLVTILDAMGVLQSEIDNWSEAIRSWTEALRILERQDNETPIYTATILHNIAEGHEARGEWILAQARLEEALNIRRERLPSDHPDLAVTLVALARTGIQLANLDLARVQHQLAEAMPLLASRRAARRSLADGYAVRAQVHKLRGYGSLALADLRKAVTIVEDLRPQRGVGGHTRAQFFAKYVRYYDTIIDWLVAVGDDESALQYAERKRARVLRDQMALAKIDVASEAGGPEVEALQHRRRDATTRINSIRRRTRELMTRTGSDGQTREELAAHERSLEAALQEHQDITERLRLVSPASREALNKDHAVLTTRQIQGKLLDPSSLLVMYQIGHETSFVFVVPPFPESIRSYPLTVPDDVASALGLEPGDFMNEACLLDILMGGADGASASSTLLGQLRGVQGLAIVDGQRAARQTTLAQRMHALWRVILPDDAWKMLMSADEVVIIPDAALHHLPFEALVLEPSDENDQSQYWLDVGPTIRYAQGIGPLYRMSQNATRPAGRKILTVSEPLYDPAMETRASRTSGPGRNAPSTSQAAAAVREDGLRERLLRQGMLKRLPGSAAETQAIQQSFDRQDVVVLRGPDATEEAVKGELPTARYIHLATHGIVDERQNDLLAALVLTPSAEGGEDGFLHLFEIYELNLDCDLAVLSACGTNFGRRIRGEGVFALSRGFLATGSRRVVASLWPVSDASTAFLVGEFFRLIGESEERDEAIPYATLLREAKKRLRRHPKWSEPFHWAPFVFIGAR